MRKAQEEGLELMKSNTSNSGFKGVTKRKRQAHPYEVEYRGKYIGHFATPEEASLSFARAAAAGVMMITTTESSMTAEEATRLAEEEGLTLVRSSRSSSGFRGVSKLHNNHAHPFEVQLKKKKIGHFATAEEGALAYARALGPEASAARAAFPEAHAGVFNAGGLTDAAIVGAAAPAVQAEMDDSEEEEEAPGQTAAVGGEAGGALAVAPPSAAASGQ